MAAGSGPVTLPHFRSRFELRLLHQIQIVHYVVPFADNGVFAIVVRWIFNLVWRIVGDRCSLGATSVDADQVDRAIAIFGIEKQNWPKIMLEKQPQPEKFTSELVAREWLIEKMNSISGDKLIKEK